MSEEFGRKPWHYKDFWPMMIKEFGNEDDMRNYLLKELIHEVHDVYAYDYDLEDRKARSLEHIASSLALLTDLLQYNVGVRLNSSSVASIAETLEEINKKL